MSHPLSHYYMARKCEFGLSLKNDDLEQNHINQRTVNVKTVKTVKTVRSQIKSSRSTDQMTCQVRDFRDPDQMTCHMPEKYCQLKWQY